jgi:hypothetical protein
MFPCLKLISFSLNVIRTPADTLLNEQIILFAPLEEKPAPAGKPLPPLRLPAARS